MRKWGLGTETEFAFKYVPSGEKPGVLASSGGEGVVEGDAGAPGWERRSTKALGILAVLLVVGLVVGGTGVVLMWGVVRRVVVATGGLVDIAVSSAEGWS